MLTNEERENNQVQLGIQVKKHTKGKRVGNTVEVFHMTIEMARKEQIKPGKHLVVVGERHYQVVVDQAKNLTITRMV